MAQQHDPTVARFISAANAAPRLTREEEEQLLRDWYGKADRRARDALVQSHLRYVVAIALKHRRYGMPTAELIAEGNFGLVRALDKFEPERGFRFVTYAAYWIRAYILGHVLSHWSMVSVGVRSKHFFRLRRERRRLESLLGDGEAARAKLSEETGIARPRLDEMLRRLDQRDVSLELRLSADSPATLGERLPANAEPQDDWLAQQQSSDCARRVVRQALETLDPRERLLIQHRLLVDGEDERTLADLGRELGISRERARQLEARGKEKLRARIAELAQTERCGALEFAA